MSTVDKIRKPRSKPHEKVGLWCLHCGKFFTVYFSSRRKFCSRLCYLEGSTSWAKGLTKETHPSIARISEKLKGHLVSEKTRKSIGQSKLGKPAWNKGKKGVQTSWCKGLSKETDPRLAALGRNLSKILREKSPHYILLTKERLEDLYVEQKLSANEVGRRLGVYTDLILSKLREYSIPVRTKSESLKGRKITWANKIGDAQRGKPKVLTSEMRQALGNKWRGKPAWNRDIPRDEKTRKKLRSVARGKYKGADNGNWKGGISYLPYPAIFDESLKEMIRNRDNYCCAWCGIAQSDTNRKLDVHHLDREKENSVPQNLVSLCRNCHAKVHGKTGLLLRLYVQSFYEKSQPGFMG